MEQRGGTGALMKDMSDLVSSLGRMAETAGAALQASSLLDAYVGVRAFTEQLALPLSAEDQAIQSMPDVSPTKWHRAHTTWFFETFILGSLADYVPCDPAYSYLFNSYYEAVGPRHARHQRGLLSRPSAAEVADYRAHVDAAMVSLLSGASASEMEALITLGLHHEQQHQELLQMDILHVLSCNPTDPAYTTAARSASVAADPQWVTHRGGLVEIGHDGVGFCFDNEGPRHSSYLEPFSLCTTTVRNGDWLAFIDDGGYSRPELWLSDGWASVTAQSWSAPLYWQRDGARWFEFTLHGLGELDLAAPVHHVSHYEADAYARWAGGRLPTEAEWELVMREQWREAAPRGLAPLADAGTDCGQVWEWTASPYVGYPGFRTAPGAVGEYNGKFMSNQMVLRGGACITPAGHSRPTYRNFFPPAARWAFSGLRLARDV